MRIIEDNSIKEKECTCQQCGSKLAYVRDDIKKGYYGGRCTSSYHYIDCPICKEKIRVLEWYNNDTRVIR